MSYKPFGTKIREWNDAALRTQRLVKNREDQRIYRQKHRHSVVTISLYRTRLALTFDDFCTRQQNRIAKRLDLVDSEEDRTFGMNVATPLYLPDYNLEVRR